MSGTEVEDLIHEVQVLLRRCTKEQLASVGESLKLSEVDKAEGKGRLLRMLNRYLNSEELEKEVDQGRQVVMRVRDELEHKILQTVESSAPTDTATTVGTQGPGLAWRKEFKIVGQIGDPGQRDRLSFVSLARQIEGGSQKGFSSEEIVEAVIRAVAPGSGLRNYLEGRPKIRLPELRRILRAHFQEKEATALFQELTTAVQAPKETTHAFVLRAMDLRQKVVFASQEAGAGVTYDLDQAQQMFLHTLSTGIWSEYVRQELQRLLKDKSTTDEVLLESLSMAVGHETERQNKLRRPRVNQVTKSSPNLTPTSESSKINDGKTESSDQKQPVHSFDWEKLQAGIKEIVRAEVSAIQQPVTQRPGHTRSPQEWGCGKCREQGKGRDCNHCFKCGSTDHFQRGCRKGRNQGNERRPPGRDTV